MPASRSTPPFTQRPRAEDFLELVERARRGRLKVYLGFAAGVGKSYRMLEKAQALKRRNVDVVIGFIETHGRAETAALALGLETVARRRFEYRGVGLAAMDVDAVIARRPQVALVDEVAHTNVPGSKHNKRYQDIEELLEAGINVICAFNIQHLEILNDVVSQVANVRVRKTVPDTFLKQADQVVTLDLDVEDLLDRLRAGKIYAPDKIPWALEHFFQNRNLATLRELALREVAESLGRSASAKTESAVKVQAADGERYLLSRGTPVYGEGGGIQGAMVILQDVTRLRRFDERKSDLVAKVAHEFRTPLTALRLAIHLCPEGVARPTSDKQSELLYAARQDCERLQ